ncbi:DEAD/DEAH box helicase [Luteipulveratus sp. YIM 133132]|uniref:DEAD/DEAH box helicase n=1 Tax=Luteipulveratus flavus TaxID=3031728 RepID=UPI0023AF1E9C|nr:DEAD/DEAH box helicase [Luteipulveratus sp. YIM 133132]MDE9366668.1 DEAD/DEAH box helicase [Luteipulveratus sp. YIM 133132]
MSEGYDVAAAEWVRRVTDAGVARICGDFALERGLGYVDAERVTSITTGDRGRLLLAVVSGSRAQPYSTMVTATGADLDGEPDWFGRCSCPVQVSCKHVVAAVLTAREVLTATDAGEEVPAPSAWRTALARLVDDEPEPSAAPRTPLGIFVAVRRRASSVRDSTPRMHIEVSPTRRTRTGRWSRSAGWADFVYRHTDRTTEPRQLQVIRELYAMVEADKVWRVATGGPTVSLHDLSPKVWTLLQRAVDAGVALVPAPGSEHEEVVLAEQPAEMTLVVGRDDEGISVTAELDHELLLDADPARPGLRLVGADEPRATRHLLGLPAHGVAVLDGTRLTLVPLAERPDEITSDLLDQPPLRVPAADAEEFTALYLPRLRERASVRAVGEQLDDSLDRLRLHVRVGSGGGNQVAVEQSFLYGDSHRVPVGLGSARRGRRRSDERRLVEQLTETLQDLGLTESVGGLGLWPVARTTVTGMAAVRLIDALDELGSHEDVVVDVVDDLPAYEQATAEPLIQVSTADVGDSDWFDLSVTVTIDQERVPFEPLFQALHRGDDHLVLESGTWFRLDHPALLRLRDLIAEARGMADPTSTSSSLQLNRFQVGLWEELVSLGVIGEQAGAWESSVDRLRQLDKLVAPEVPAAFRAQLRPYQEDGYAWLATLWDAGLGGVLADDMGLGKTVQTLALLARAKEADEIGGAHGPVLVVAPTSVVGAWATEAAAFSPDLRVVAVTETSKKRAASLAEVAAVADVVVTSYAVLRLDADAFHAQRWRGLVLDEAQMVKNHQSKTYQAARRIGAPFTLAISGTPLENSLMDLWSLLSLTAPGLYPQPDVFSETYRRPIESGGHPELLDQLRRRIRPLMLRRTKAAVAADLPEKQVQVLSVPPHPVHARIYDQHLTRERQRILGLLDDPDANRVAILASLTRLRQLALDPALVDETYAGAATSAKVAGLIEQLREISQEGHRALVFSQFTTYLRMVEQALAKAGLGTCYLDGSMTVSARTAQIDQFRTGDADAFLISLKAGGTGLTLTEADYVFVLDPWWNPAAEAQAIDRTHRIGQDKPVMVYRMVSRGTIEEKVVALQDKKRELFDRVVDEGGALSGRITADDIRALLD